ncbi:MAG: FtsX-like permease family protein, partial [Proteobacteria bacterium]|nr:FtsX-like permease family protein [Pseudomonadota bacterium]
SISSKIVEGSLEGFEANEKIVVGKRLAQYMNVSVGDKLKLISPKGPSTPFGSAPRQKSYEIGGIFEVGMSEFDASFIFMPLNQAQLYFDSEGQVGMIELFIDNPDKIDNYVAAIREAVGKPHGLTDWRFRNRTFFGALEVERNVMFLILMLIVIVAALNIISGLTMLVKDKARGIAILRTMGATRGSILAIFVMTGAAIGVGGTFFGFLLGLLIATNVESLRQVVSWLSGAPIFPPELYFLSKLPADVRPTEVVAIVGLALVLSLLATIYPAWRAAKLDPVEALRGE